MPLPDGWKRSRLDDLLLGLDYGVSVPLADAGTLPVLRMMNLKDGRIDTAELRFSDSNEARRLLLQDGDVLFNRTNSMQHVGRTAIWRSELPQASFASYCVRLICNRQKIRPEFLTLVMNLPETQASIKQLATPAVQQVNVNPTQLRQRLWICYPHDVAEQARISDIIDAVDDSIRQTAAVIAKLKQVRAGLLHDLMTCGLDEHGQLRDPVAHPEQFKESALGRIPRVWEVVRINEAGKVRLGRQRSPAHESGRNMKPYLRVANVFDGFIDYTDVLIMNFEPSEQQAYDLVPGDILLNEGQSLELVGRSAIFPGPQGMYCFQNTLVRFRCNETTNPTFCQAVFKYWLDTRRFTLVAKQTTSVAHLGSDRFASMPFARPPLEEQRRIAEHLTLQHQEIASEGAILDKLTNLKSGLMSDLLTGRVRVPEVIGGATS